MSVSDEFKLDGDRVMLTFQVFGIPVPKPRMTIGDKRGKKRPVVVRYHAWCDLLRATFRATRNGLPPTEARRFPLSSCSVRVALGLITAKKQDCSNYLKGIEDALIGELWEDDSVVNIPSCEGIYAFYLCVNCPTGERTKSGIKCVKRKCCPFSGVIIQILQPPYEYLDSGVWTYSGIMESVVKVDERPRFAYVQAGRGRHERS